MILFENQQGGAEDSEGGDFPVEVDFGEEGHIKITHRFSSFSFVHTKLGKY